MALQIFGTNFYGAGLQVNLTTTDSVFVAAGVTVGSTNTTAIQGTGSNHTVNIQGSVVGNYDTVTLGDDSATDSGQRLIVGSNGYIGQFHSSGYGAWIKGFNSLIENSGTIWSNFVGLVVVGTNATTQSKILNEGVVDAKSHAIYHGGTETLALENSGIIKSNGNAYFDAVGYIDQITNTGKMIGAVVLNGGNDIFDTRLGTLSGALDAGLGTDKLYGSTLADIFYGGGDADTIYGYDGNDKLFGDTGNDALVGGAGADALSGGDGIDRVYYSGATAGITVSLLTTPSVLSKI